MRQAVPRQRGVWKTNKTQSTNLFCTYNNLAQTCGPCSTPYEQNCVVRVSDRPKKIWVERTKHTIVAIWLCEKAPTTPRIAGLRSSSVQARKLSPYLSWGRSSKAYQPPQLKQIRFEVRTSNSMNIRVAPKYIRSLLTVNIVQLPLNVPTSKWTEGNAYPKFSR